MAADPFGPAAMLFLRLRQHQHLGAPGQVRPQPVCVDGIFIVRAPIHPHAALRGALAQPGGLIRKVGHAVRALLIPYLMQQVAPVEMVVLLSKLNTKQHIEVELNLDELDLTAAESKATYDEIKAYVLEKYGLKVSSLYISQVKRKCGLEVGQNYNLSKKEDAKVPQCPPEKEAAIMEALRHFQMI